jgi:hypothetical protein
MGILKYAPDLANLVAGVYKGYANAAGVDVGPACLLYTLGIGAFVEGIRRTSVTMDNNKNPFAIVENIHRQVNTIGTAFKEGRYTDGSRSLRSFRLGKNPMVEGAKGAAKQSAVGVIEIGIGYVIGRVAYMVFS